MSRTSGSHPGSGAFASIVLVVVITLMAGLAAGAHPAEDVISAVRKGDLAALNVLLDRNPELVNEPDRYSLAPLHWAALEGQRQAAEELLARGANINLKTRLGRTAYQIALQHSHQDVADMLRERGADPAPWTWPRITGNYVGETPPGRTPRLFGPEILSSVIFDHAAPAFTRDGDEVFWAVVFENDTGFLMGMKRDGEVWGELRPLPFSEAKFRDICPTLSEDGKQLYFTSCRPARAGEKGGSYNMWVVDRRGRGWSEPRLLAPEIASGRDARPVFSGAGTMYFGSWRDGALDGTNIFISKPAGGKFGNPQRLEASFNTSNVMPTYISRDEGVILFESFRAGGLGGSDFWLCARGPDGSWGPAVNLGEPVNSRGNDWFGGFSPDGKYFFFVSDRDGNNDIYWVDAKILGDLHLLSPPRPARNRPRNVRSPRAIENEYFMGRR